jgi:Predicted glutamine amidotransferase
MCELLGVSSAEPIDISPYLRVFSEHGKKFPHGWGLFWQNSGGFEILKEPVCAAKSGVLGELLENELPQKTILAHIRYATIGSIKTVNCHPFQGTDSTGRLWTLTHNGSIYSGRNLTKFLNEQQGDTDSERVLLFIIDEINKAQKDGSLTLKKRFDVVDAAIKKLAPRNKLNLMLYDGELLYVHKNMQNSLSCKRDGKGLVFATTPLDDGDWKDFPLSKVCAFRNGELVFEGKAHNEIFRSCLDLNNPFFAMNI